MAETPTTKPYCECLIWVDVEAAMWFDEIFTSVPATMVYTVNKNGNITLGSHLATATSTDDPSLFFQSINSFEGEGGYFDGRAALTTLNSVIIDYIILHYG